MLPHTTSGVYAGGIRAIRGTQGRPAKRQNEIEIRTSSGPTPLEILKVANLVADFVSVLKLRRILIFSDPQIQTAVARLFANFCQWR